MSEITSGMDVYDPADFQIFHAHGSYEPFTRWHVVDAIHALDLDVLDDWLPFAINDPSAIVYAIVPLPPEELGVLKLLYRTKTAGYSLVSLTASQSVAVVAFPVTSMPRCRFDLLRDAKAAQDAYFNSAGSKVVGLLHTNGGDTRKWRVMEITHHELNVTVSMNKYYLEPPPPLEDVFDRLERLHQRANARPKLLFGATPFRQPGNYGAFDRWDIIEMLHGFGVEPMDDHLPYVIDNDKECVHALLPNDDHTINVCMQKLAEINYKREMPLGIRVTRYTSTVDDFIEMLGASMKDHGMVMVRGPGSIDILSPHSTHYGGKWGFATHVEANILWPWLKPRRSYRR